MKKISLSTLFVLISAATFAQTEESTAPVIAEPSLGLTTTELIIVALLLFALVLLVVSIILFNAFKVMLKERANPTPYQKYKPEEPLDYEEWVKQQKSKWKK